MRQLNRSSSVIGLVLASTGLFATMPSAVADATIVAEQLGALPNPSNDTVKLSPDGARVACITQDGGAQVLVVDGTPGPGYTRIHADTIGFAGDASACAFVATKTGQQHVVIARDGAFHESPAYPSVQQIITSPGHDRIAWIAHWPAEDFSEEPRSQVFIDGVAGPEAVRIAENSFTFSPDGEHYTYVAQREMPHPEREGRTTRAYHIVFNGAISPAFNTIARHNEDDDGRYPILTNPGRVLFCAGPGVNGPFDLMQMTADGDVAVLAERVREVDDHAGDQRYIHVSADREHWAALIEQPESDDAHYRGRDIPLAIVVDGDVKQQFEGGSRVAQLAISPDGSRFACRASEQLAQGARPVTRVHVDGEPVGEFRSAQPAVFSANSDHVAFIADTAGDRVVYFDGEAHGPYKRVFDMTAAPEGGDIAWFATPADQNKHVAFVNGEPVEIGEADEFSAEYQQALFAPDGSAFAFEAERYSNESVMVVDGDPHHIVANIQHPVFSADGDHLAYAATQAEDSKPRARVIILDGEPLRDGHDFDQVRQLAFSPDGEHVIAEVQVEKGVAIAVDGFPGPDFEPSRVPVGIHFPDENTIAYYGMRDDILTRFTVDLDAMREQGSAIASAAADSAYEVIHLFPGKPGAGQGGRNLIVTHEGVIFGYADQGEYDAGVIFSVKADGSDYQELYHLPGGSHSGRNQESLFISQDGSTLYGDDGKGVFRIGTDGSDFEYIAERTDFGSAKLFDLSPDGTLLGVASERRVIRMDPDTGHIEKIYPPDDLDLEFNDPRQGFLAVTYHDGVLYGPSFKGRAILSLNLADGIVNVLHEFEGKPFDLTYLKLPVVITPDGHITGMGEYGGKNNDGGVFSMNRDGSDYQFASFDEDWATMSRRTYGGQTLGPDGRWYAHVDQFGDKEEGPALIVRGANDEHTQVAHRLPEDALDPRAMTLGPDGNIYALGNLGRYEPGGVYRIALDHEKQTAGPLAFEVKPQPTGTYESAAMSIEHASADWPDWYEGS